MRPTRDDAIPRASELDWYFGASRALLLHASCHSTTTMDQIIQYLIGLVDAGEEYLDSLGERSPDEIATDNTAWDDNEASSARGRLARLLQMIGKSLNPSSGSTPPPTQGEAQDGEDDPPVRAPSKAERRKQVSPLFSLVVLL